MEFTYNSYGDIDSMIIYIRNEPNNQWLLMALRESTYDGMGNLSVGAYYHWGANTSKWLLNDKNEYSYDDNGNIHLITDYFITGDSTGKLIPAHRSEYTHDVDGNMTLEINYKWNSDIRQWDAWRKAGYLYVVNGNLDRVIFYDWQNYFTQWVEVFKYEYTYDVNGYNTGFTNYGWHQNKWLLSYKVTHFYSEKNITSVPKTHDRILSVYPNPASDYIVFDLAKASNTLKVELFDLRGKKVLEQELAGDRRVTVGNLSEGLYLYRLNDRGIIYNGKFIVE